jgi:hypothetical protein
MITNLLRVKRLIGVSASALGLLLLLVSAAESQKLRSEEEIAPIVALEQISIKDGIVQGVVRNKSDHAVRDVQLFIRYTWLWDDERNPGKIDPGTSTYYTLKETIQPKATINFIFAPSPPLPKIAGGRFDASVKIAGFTEIIPQKK